MTRHESIAFLREIQDKIKNMSDEDFYEQFEQSGAAEILQRYDAKIRAEARDRFCRLCSPSGECDVSICHDEMAILGIGPYRDKPDNGEARP